MGPDGQPLSFAMEVDGWVDLDKLAVHTISGLRRARSEVRKLDSP